MAPRTGEIIAVMNIEMLKPRAQRKSASRRPPATIVVKYVG